MFVGRVTDATVFSAAFVADVVCSVFSVETVDFPFAEFVPVVVGGELTLLELQAEIKL